MTFELSRIIVFWYSKSYFDIRTEWKTDFFFIFTFLIWHLNWVGKCYFGIENPIWHSNWVGKCYFGIQNPILTFELCWKIVFRYSKSYFDIRTETENRIQNPILTFELSRKIEFMIFKILFRHLKWVGRFYFDIKILIFTFELSRKIVSWHSKFYFYIRTESGNAILIFKILFFSIRTVSENPILTLKIPFWHSNWVEKCYFCIQSLILTFELNRKMLFSYSKSYFDTRSESENTILIFKILFWHSNRIGKSYFDIQNPILTFELSGKMLFWYSKF